MTNTIQEPESMRSQLNPAFRVLIWFCAAVLFMVFSGVAEYASGKKEELEAYEKWRAYARQLILQEAAGRTIGRDCRNDAKCIDEFRDRLRGTEKIEEEARKLASGLAGTDKPVTPYDDWFWKRTYFLWLIIGWVGEAFTGLVMLEGLLRLAVWSGRKAGVLEKKKWEEFNDKLLDKIAEFATEKSSMAAVLPFLAAMTAAGGIVYVSSPPWDGGHPGGTPGQPMTIVGPNRIEISFVSGVPTGGGAKDPDDIKREVEELKNIVATVNGNLSTATIAEADIANRSAASAAQVVSDLADSNAKLKHSIAVLDVVQRISADGYVHGVFSTEKCRELDSVRRKDEDLERFFGKMGLRNPPYPQTELKEYADLIITVFCHIGTHPGVAKTVPNPDG